MSATFRNVTLCSLVQINGPFRGSCCLHTYLKVWGIRLLRI